MKQKYLLIISAGILSLLLVIIILLTIFTRPSSLTNTNIPISTSPTTYHLPPTSSLPPNGAIEDITPTKKPKTSSLDIIDKIPSPTSKNKTLNSKSQYPTPIYNSQLPIHKNPNPSTKPLPTIFNNLQPIATIVPTLPSGSLAQSFFLFGTPTPSYNLQPTPNNLLPTTYNLQPNQYQYFSQCGGQFDNYQFPQGCNMCDSGCGPTTLAMILSTYLKKTITPVDAVEIYKQNNMYAGCDGTKVTDAQEIIAQKGLKVTDLMMLIPMTKQDAITEMKKYTDNGWTIFTLGRYCANGCSHFFWITKIDDNNKVWSYDPYYNKDIPPPLDVSNYDPYPEYRIAFGVKK